MPTQPGTPSAPLDTKQAAEKFAGLITEEGDELPPADSAAAAPTAEAEKPVPSETPPPAASESESPDETDDAVYTVQVDGEPVEVSLKELQESFSYKAHNTRRAQELAEKEKRLEPEIRARLEREVADAQTQYVNGIATLRQALEELQGEPNWTELRGKVSDAEYLKQRADWEETKAQRERLRRHEEDERQKLQTAQQKQYQESVRAEYDKLLAQIPEWKETEKAKADISALKGFAKKQYGFAEEHVQNLVDHRLYLLLRDAMKYHELQREPSPQVKAKVAPIKTAKPGTPARPRPNERQQKLIEQSKSGRQRDAMAAIEAMLTD